MRPGRQAREKGFTLTVMPKRQTRLRGLSELRTLSGLGSRDVAPHTAYMKITSLELEKLRLSRVRQNAARRIAEIDARCAEIQQEKSALLAASVAAPAFEPRHSLARRVGHFDPRSARSLRY
jgi:hypothetical protein